MESDIQTGPDLNDSAMCYLATINQIITAAKKNNIENFPYTVAGLIRKAVKEKWPKRKRRLRGGGYEYDIKALPEPVRIAVVSYLSEQESINRMPLKYSPGAVWAEFKRISLKKQKAAEERLNVVQYVFNLRKAGIRKGPSVEQAAARFCVSKRTIEYWLDRIEGIDPKDWLPLLVEKKLSAKKEKEAPGWWPFFCADYLRLENPSMPACYNRLLTWAKQEGYEIPSLSTVKRMVKKIPKEILVAKRNGPDSLAQLYPAQQRDKTALSALEWINGDGYKHNVLVRWIDGEIIRPKTFFMQDVYSNFMLAYRTDVSENTDMLRLSYMDVCFNYGVPKHITLDNTMAAANKIMSGGTKNRFRYKFLEGEPDGIFKINQTEIHFTKTGWGQSKPEERANGIGGMGEYVDKHPLLAGAWTGNNTLEKPENYGSRIIEYDDFIKALDDGVRTWNELKGRRTAVCRNELSYAEAFAESYKTAHIRKLSEDQRFLFMLAVEGITVARNGLIKLKAGKSFGVGQNHYFHESLINHAGEKIIVRFDPQKLHSPVHCSDSKGREICWADCFLPAGFGDRAAARDHNRARNAFVRDTKRAAKQYELMNIKEVAALLPYPEPQKMPAAKVIEPIFKKPCPETDEMSDTEFEEGFSNGVEMHKERGGVMG